MREKFSFLHAGIWFDVTECKFIMKNSSVKMLVVFSIIFVKDTKITFFYNIVAPSIIKPFGLLNTIPLTNTKTLVNNMLISKF